LITPLVSIIIPTFNREKELERALNSVFSQTYTNWEICIVDNNSSDNSIQLINNYNNPRIKLYTINNKGVIGASRNLGIQKAKGKYLAFLDSDDWWSSRKLEVSVKFLEQGKASVVYHDLFIVKKESQKFFF
jgi:glycosyltransferase involved in cell wall biosynthesis